MGWDGLRANRIVRSSGLRRLDKHRSHQVDSRRRTGRFALFSRHNRHRLRNRILRSGVMDHGRDALAPGPGGTTTPPGPQPASTQQKGVLGMAPK